MSVFEPILQATTVFTQHIKLYFLGLNNSVRARPTMGVSDGVVNMRDIQYLIMHFNAKAPIPGKPLDSKWVGVYGANGAVDPDGDRLSNMRDIQGTIIDFNHRMNTTTP